MFRIVRNLIVLGLLIGGLYAVLETEQGQQTVSNVMSAIQSGASLGNDDQGSYGNHSHHEVEKLRRTSGDRFRYDTTTAQRLGALPSEPEKMPKLVGTNVEDLREVMRFDISPRWVIDRFSRVSTVLAEIELQGLRVPIVTGTSPDDLAGTLTYYFDSSDRLQRVTVHGFTGDPTELANTMTAYYGMSREPSLEAGVFTRRWNGQPVHFLRLTHAPVVYADAVHQKYTVFMELNQPDLPYGISREARRIVESDQKTGRW